MNRMFFPSHVLNLSKPRQCLYHPLENKTPNSESVGFRVSISGAGEWRQENAHPEKTEQSWNLAGTFQEPCWNRAVLEPCWSLAGMLQEPDWNWNHVGTFELLPWLRCLVVILGPKTSFGVLFVFSTELLSEGFF